MAIDWMMDDGIEGRVNKGKSRTGDLPETVTLQLPGKLVYQIQKFFEDSICRGGDYWSVRWLVLANEDLRKAIVKFRDSSPPRR